MRKRPFFIASLVFVLAAIALQAGALGQAGRAASLRGDGVVSPDDQKSTLFARADHLLNQSKISRSEGYLAAAFGVVCLIASYLRKEPARRIIPVVLVLGYAVLQFVPA